MRRLIVLRHGKSSWSTQALSDHERPLKRRGRKSARLVGVALVREGLVPQRVLCSDAVRAVQTWEHVREGLGEAGAAVEARILAELYLGEIFEFRAALADTPAEVETVAVIGHDPDLSALASKLAGAPVELKTADAAIFTLSSPWPEALDGPSELQAVWRSRELLAAADEA